MYEIKNKILRDIAEGLEEGVTVDDSVLQYIEDGVIREHIEELVTELTVLLSSQAEMEWYKLLYRACCKEHDQDIWAHAITDAFRKGCPVENINRYFDEAEDLKNFQKLIQNQMKTEELHTGQTMSENKGNERKVGGQHTTPVQSQNMTHKEPRAIMSQSEDASHTKPCAIMSQSENQSDYAGQAMHIVNNYMNSQVSSELTQNKSADDLITLAMKTRDCLKEYESRINALNNIVTSQKQLIESQQCKIRAQEEELDETKNKIRVQENQLTQLQQKSGELNQTLRKLSNIQSELHMIGITSQEELC